MSDDGGISPFYIKLPTDRIKITKNEARKTLIVDHNDFLTDESLASIEINHCIFKYSDDPINRMKAFVNLYEMGYYPPPEAIKWIAEAFDLWEKSNGEKSLDLIFEFWKPENRSGANQLKKKRYKRHIESYCTELARLRYFLGIKIKDAANMLAERMLCDAGIKYEPDTIIENYKSLRKSVNWIKDYTITMTDEKRLEILSRYPRHTYQHLVKTNLILRRVAEIKGG